MAAKRVILVGCVKLKLDTTAPAQELYASPLWRRRRKYAERCGGEWMILSAKHGLLDPKQRIAPYDVALSDLSADERRTWGRRVISQLEGRLDSLAGITFEIHAGSPYRHAIAAGIAERGGTVTAPLEGLGMGEQLAWYTSATGSTGLAVTIRRRTSTDAEFRAAIRALDEMPVLIAAREWPPKTGGLDKSGLYSWWVDDAGAEDLSRGLAFKVGRGRIYAGQTGATKWPSGKVGSRTLREGISSQHLRGRIRGSTFRLTLASVLAEELGLDRTAAKRMGGDGEDRLSTWMRDHLTVAVHTFDERDALADLEHRVLAKLDPPLNLDGRPVTDLRLALTRLRTA